MSMVSTAEKTAIISLAETYFAARGSSETYSGGPSRVHHHRIGGPLRVYNPQIDALHLQRAFRGDVYSLQRFCRCVVPVQSSYSWIILTLWPSAPHVPEFYYLK